MIGFIITNTAIAITAFAFGVLVLRKEPDNVAYQSFFIFTAGIALSSAAKPFFQEDQNFLIFLLVWWGFEVMVLGVFTLARVSPDGKFDAWSTWSLIPWFFLFVSIPALLIAASFRADPDAFFWQTYHDIFPVFAVFMVAHLTISFFSCMRRRVSTFGLPFHLVRGLMLVVIFSASIMCVADLILPAFGIYRFSTESNFFALIVLVVGGYGIVRYGTGNGVAVLQRAVSYFLSLISVALIFFSIEFGIEKFFYRNDEVVDIMAAVAGALAFCPLRTFFNELTDHLFFRDSYHFFTALRELGERLSVSFDRDALLVTVAEFLNLTIKPTETIFFEVGDDQSKKVSLISGLGANCAARADCIALAAFFLEHAQNATIITDIMRLFRMNRSSATEIPCELIKERAARLGIAAIVPVLVRGKAKMIVMVGHKCSGALFDKDDGELLGLVARRAAMSIENFELRELMDRQAKRFEEHVTARTERLKSMYELQSKFLTDVSHELKTPLAILKMNASIFAESKNAEQKKAWYIMDTTLDRLTRLVSDLLDVARSGSLRDEWCKKCVPVGELLSEARDDCAILAEEKRVKLFLSSGEISVLGEWDKLKEVMLNLLSNALQHSLVGGSNLLTAHESDGEAEIMVRDNGSGISRENLPHIFERFYRIRECSPNGTGIGLYLCRQIIEGHGGTITAESRKGNGSCFVVRLPIFPRDA